MITIQTTCLKTIVCCCLSYPWRLSEILWPWIGYGGSRGAWEQILRVKILNIEPFFMLIELLWFLWLLIIPGVFVAVIVYRGTLWNLQTRHPSRSYHTVLLFCITGKFQPNPLNFFSSSIFPLGPDISLRYTMYMMYTYHLLLKRQSSLIWL